jgi:EAL domain-containing protein (putative c-di-GMP-specific phosphodiesterase class I)
MLGAVREWFSRSDELSGPLCLVAAADDPLRERLAGVVSELGLRTEQCATAAAASDRAAALQPDIVFLDLAFGNDVGGTIARLAALKKRPALQLVSAVEVKTYEQLCAVGQARIAADKAGLRVLENLQPPFKPETIRKRLQDLGLGGNADKPAVTLAQALKHNWLELWYQPKISLAHKRLVGAEGLIRVRHPELGVLSPAAFLPGAREEDLLAMTERVIMDALQDYDELAANGVSIKLSVNTPVSALTTLPIAQMLREGRPAAENFPGLILEVTEDEIVNDLALANDVANELRAHQCSLAIDDFGAGYSSLSRLRQLPFSELKIDRSYVTDCNTDRTNAGLCETIVELAHRFGLNTVAEGVETTHESHKLQGLGCNIGQGYLFAKPMSKQDFLSILRRRMVQKAEAQDSTPQRLAPVRFNTKA